MMNMDFISLTIDNQEVEVTRGSTVLEAAKSTGIKIPVLCVSPGFNPSGFCRSCVVEIEGEDQLYAACALPVQEGMVVKTNSPRVIASHKLTTELTLARHTMDCAVCYRNGKCDLQELADTYGIKESRFFAREQPMEIDSASPAIVHNPNRCIGCGLCVQACGDIQTVSVIDFAYRGFERKVQPAFGQSLNDIECVACGQCIQACPVEAFYEKSDLDLVMEALRDPTKIPVACVSPPVTISIGEEFGIAPERPLTGELIKALKIAGFQKVFDTAFGADLTIMEEAYALHIRLNSGKNLPMITSCSPEWVKFIEHFYPELLSHLCTTKSPQQMLGVLIKSHLAEVMHVDPKNLFTVSITPCTAEKFERTRPEMTTHGFSSIDACLTVKEMARLIRMIHGELFPQSDTDGFDDPFDEASGAGTLFTAAGGVMEGVLRTLYELKTGKKLKSVVFDNLRGEDGLRETQIQVGNETLKVAVVHGLGNARKLLENIRSGQKKYHFVEVKGCPNGCAHGGGQPLPVTPEVIRAREQALYARDEKKKIRKAHDNPKIKELYEKFLKKPGSVRTKKLLHTEFIPRKHYL
jgi:iron-only hydrogenase group A